MDKEDITAFQVLARELNFTRAAEELFLPQPTLSKRIARLEEEIGVKLFERTKRRVELTNAGRLFVLESQRLQQHQAEMLDKVRRAANDTRLHLSIDFMGLGVARKMLPLLQKFNVAYPQVATDVNLANFRRACADLDADRSDIIIAGDFGLSVNEDLDTATIFPAHNVLILPSAHYFLQKQSRDFSKLRGERFIALQEKISPQGYKMILDICHSWGFVPQITKECQSIEEIFFYIQAGQGIAMLPDFDCPPADLYPLSYLEIPKAEYSFPTVAAWKKKNKNPAVDLFLSFIQ